MKSASARWLIYFFGVGPMVRNMIEGRAITRQRFHIFWHHLESVIIQFVADLHAFGAPFTLGGSIKIPNNAPSSPFLCWDIDSTFACAPNANSPMRVRCRPRISLNACSTLDSGIALPRIAVSGTFRHTSHAADTFRQIERGNLRSDITEIAQCSRPGGIKLRATPRSAGSTADPLPS